MRAYTLMRAFIGCVFSGCVAMAASPIELTVHTSSDAGKVDEKIYGHFLEHIYHSVNGGLWSEMVWNRSFEQRGGPGAWTVEGDSIAQMELAPDVRLTFGSPEWTDYTYSLEAMKTAGSEGFLILFRSPKSDAFYWLNLGGWANTRHAIERGRDGAKTIVGSSIPGQIETGRWYRIEIRCIGRRFMVNLDGKPLLDADDPEGFAAGGAGVGTWQTAAMFRNFKLTDAEGRVLHSGLPALPASAGLAFKWERFGTDGRVSLGSDHALNGERYQLLEAAGVEMGIEQKDHVFKRGETYHGSLWARGSGGPLAVHLCDGTRAVSSARFSAIPGGWKEHPFELTIPRDVLDGSLRITAAGDSSICIDQVSLAPRGAKRFAGCRPDLYQAVSDLRPPFIRWPGGCFAEYYRWKSGIGPQHRRTLYPITIWDDQDVNSYGTDEFIATCRMLGTEPLLVINIGRRDPEGTRDQYIQEACDWVEYCNGPADSTWGKVRAANGHLEPYGVKFWEIDNETWHMGAEAYAEAVRAFVPAMKKVDPSIRIVVCGSCGFDLEWNRRTLEGCAELADYLSIHHYENPDLFAEGPRKYEEFFRKTGGVIASSKNPRVRIFVSEWNAQSTDWRTGLYAGGLLNAFERCGDMVEMASPALFLRHASAREWDNAFINFDSRSWFPAPNYVVMKLWRDHFGPVRVKLTGDAGPLNVSATKRADGRQVCIKLVNPSDRPAEIRLKLEAPATPAKAALKLVAPDALTGRNTLSEPNKIVPVEKPVILQGSGLEATLPRWSAGVIVVEMK